MLAQQVGGGLGDGCSAERPLPITTQDQSSALECARSEALCKMPGHNREGGITSAEKTALRLTRPLIIHAPRHPVVRTVDLCTTAPIVLASP